MSLPETKPNPSSSLSLALQSKLSWLSRVWHVTVINYHWSAFDWFPLWHEVNKGECDWCWQILHTELTELTKKCVCYDFIKERKKKLELVLLILFVRVQKFMWSPSEGLIMWCRRVFVWYLRWDMFKSWKPEMHVQNISYTNVIATQWDMFYIIDAPLGITFASKSHLRNYTL